VTTRRRSPDGAGDGDRTAPTASFTLPSDVLGPALTGQPESNDAVHLRGD